MILQKYNKFIVFTGHDTKSSNQQQFTIITKRSFRHVICITSFCIQIFSIKFPIVVLYLTRNYRSQLSKFSQLAPLEGGCCQEIGGWMKINGKQARAGSHPGPGNFCNKQAKRLKLLQTQILFEHAEWHKQEILLNNSIMKNLRKVRRINAVAVEQIKMIYSFSNNFLHSYHV